MSDQFFSLYKYEKKVESPVVNAGFFEPSISSYNMDDEDSLDTNGQILKFEKEVESKVEFRGDFQFPSWD